MKKWHGMNETEWITWNELEWMEWWNGTERNGMEWNEMNGTTVFKNNLCSVLEAGVTIFIR